eukprot:CAMPEP_0196769714 /NCGR_PEP_ID=MMETSP1104-20130614/711_1 /TAXON_ID=33652 /ORGANISM="Cafeteria sp., Strain Caron Lab Isolate" /LENGTH=378 /DNA_ID=CAMNT_0042139815 /DNA_START=13 /DNA_END=1146 /DNA_ORIENTATION=+
MPLESCIICMDNSEHSRNGDYAPDRLAAQYDAVSIMIGRKLNPPSHPESTVGLMLSGGSPEVLASPTRDQGHLMAAMHGIEPRGKAQFGQALKIAQLALKHRPNKAGGQRVVIFVAGPIHDETRALQRIAKDLKKNNVAVDVVSMGEHEDNKDLLSSFIEAVSKDNNSNLVVIPAGSLPSNVLMQSPILNEDGGMGGGGGGSGGGGGGAFSEYGGFDPNTDPDIALAMRMSLEEQKQRMEEQAGSDAPAGTGAGGAEDDMLQQALALSMMEAASGGSGSGSGEAGAGAGGSSGGGGGDGEAQATDGGQGGTGGDEDEDLDEEALLARALAMSQEESEQAAASAASAPASAPAPAPAPAAAAGGADFNDPAFVQQLLHG